MFIVDGNGKIRNFNDASRNLFKDFGDNLYNKNLFNILGYKRQKYIRFFKKFFKSNEEYCGYFKTRVKEKCFYFDLHIVTNQLVYIVYLKDITGKHKLDKELEATSLNTIRLLSQVIEEKDSYTKEHCLRIEKLCVTLAEKLEIKGKKLKQLRFGAIMHDVGKIATPDEILLKPGGLTRDEYKIIQQHPSVGANLVRKISGLSEAADIVEQHHERYDGKGYPNGLKGDEIHLSSQILCVVDAYDAMTTDRPYRNAIAKDEAIKEIMHCSGTQFSPYIANAFIEFIREYEG